jgi:hypothetical protein
MDSVGSLRLGTALNQQATAQWAGACGNPAGPCRQPDWLQHRVGGLGGPEEVGFVRRGAA